ncbi:MAG: alpha/beta fold hydrolase [Candidatus Woykebacteria bacterium]
MTSKPSKKREPTKVQKRLILVHGWEGSPEHGWFPWLKVEMEKRGWEVLAPAMPNTNEPKIYEWLPYLKQVAGEVDERTFMVGHSLGCITILRLLENIPEGQKIGGSVLVAGFDNPLKNKELGNFFEAPINWVKIKENCKKFVSIHSVDDPYVPIENSISYERNLSAKTLKLSGWRHFSGDEGTTSVPPVLEELLSISA